MIYWYSPSGDKYKSNNKDFKENIRKAASAFPSAQGKGDLYQDNGYYSSTMNLQFTFETLEESEAFSKSLLEKGASKLIEPTTSIVRYVQVLSLHKKKGFIKDVMRYKYSVSLAESKINVKQESTDSYLNQSNIKSSDSESLVADIFATQTVIETASEKAQQTSNFRETLEKVNDTIGNTVDDMINQVDEIIEEPYATIMELKTLIDQPANIYSDVNARLRVYQGLLVSCLSQDTNYNIAQTERLKLNNAIYAQSVGAMVLNSMVVNAVNLPYERKSQLFLAIDLLKASYEYYRDYLDILENAGDFHQDGSIQQSISELVYNSAGELYKISFSLKNEVTFEVEDDSTTPLDIALKYYSEEFSVDQFTTLDFVENTNDFDNIQGFVFPKGYTIKVYI